MILDVVGSSLLDVNGKEPNNIECKASRRRGCYSQTYVECTGQRLDVKHAYTARLQMQPVGPPCSGLDARLPWWTTQCLTQAARQLNLHTRDRLTSQAQHSVLSTRNLAFNSSLVSVPTSCVQSHKLAYGPKCRMHRIEGELGSYHRFPRELTGFCELFSYHSVVEFKE